MGFQKKRGHPVIVLTKSTSGVNQLSSEISLFLLFKALLLLNDFNSKYNFSYVTVKSIFKHFCANSNLFGCE